MYNLLREQVVMFFFFYWPDIPDKRPLSAARGGCASLGLAALLVPHDNNVLRNKSGFACAYLDGLCFLTCADKLRRWIHSICDSPQGFSFQNSP